MIIVLHGPDSYRRLRKLNDIIAVHQKKHPSAALTRFDLTNPDDFLRFKEFIASQSIFSRKKMAILENIWSVHADLSKKKKADDASEQNKPLIKELKIILKSVLNDSDSFIVISENKTPPVALIFLLEAPVLGEKFDELKGASFRKFAKEEAAEIGLNLAPDALEFLAKFFEGNTWGLATELQKLRWLRPEDKSAGVGLGRLKSAGDYFEPESFLDFINALSYPSDLRRKISALENVFSSREDLVKVFNILQSRNFDFRMLLRLADYDIMVKSGKMEYDEVLLDLVLS